MFHTIIHLSAHLFLPAMVSRIAYPAKWKKIGMIMLATMVIDVDHLLASPVFDANRCSLGFHPLHSYLAIALYILMLNHNKTRVIAIGLLIHMLIDGLDCVWMS